jgi:hypothetical protein
VSAYERYRLARDECLAALEAEDPIGAERALVEVREAVEAMEAERADRAVQKEAAKGVHDVGVWLALQDEDRGLGGWA